MKNLLRSIYLVILVIVSYYQYLSVLVPPYDSQKNSICIQDPGLLSSYIAAGRTYYFRSFVECRVFYSKGYVDYLYRASGLFLKKEPREFLQVMSEYNIMGDELKNFLVKLPLSATDDIEQKKSDLKDRIRLIQGVNNSRTKLAALEILSKELDFLNTQAE